LEIYRSDSKQKSEAYLPFFIINSQLFDNTGSFFPLDVKTIVIYHNPNDLVIINTSETSRPQIINPLPYLQSPLLQISDETDSTVNPTLIKLWDPDFIYSGLHDFCPFQQSPIIGEFFAFLPQLSYPAKAHLFSLLQTDTDYWFQDSLVQILVSNPERFLGYKDHQGHKGLGISSLNFCQSRDCQVISPRKCPVESPKISWPSMSTVTKAIDKISLGKQTYWSDSSWHCSSVCIHKRCLCILLTHVT